MIGQLKIQGQVSELVAKGEGDERIDGRDRAPWNLGL